MLSPFSIVLVLSAALLHAGWNALLRGGADRAQSMLIMNVTVGIAGIAMMAFAGLPSWASAPYVVASGLIHLVYNALLVRMYRSGDLGETYPVARGSSPALIALGGSLFAGEWMGLIGAIGIGLVCAGIFMLAATKGRLREMNLPAALATGITIAVYSIVDGLGVRISGNWVSYTGGMFAFFLAVPIWYLARGRARGVRGIACRSHQGGQRRADFAGGLWRHHLGDAGQPDGRGVGIARNQRGVRRLARRRVPGRAPDGVADRGVLHHRAGRGVRRLAILSHRISNEKRPGAGRGVLISRLETEP